MREIEFQEEAARTLARVLGFCARGLRVIDPARTDIRGDLEFGSNVTVEVNVIFKGKVKLGDNVSIGAHSVIEDSVIEEGASIMDFSTISSAHVGPNARIGPYARLRPGSQIGGSCQIGNFVEVKETTMGMRCKINHHSFVGNATLGHDVVMGAGSITCNHDRQTIQHTVIGDGAYIGSGVMLIAPLRIGESTVIAAGSTITQDVPDNMLAICRTKAMVLKPRKARASG